MVNRAKRRQYAELLRHFVAGRLTNFEYEKQADRLIEEESDKAIFPIWHEAWFLYDDLRQHRLTGTWRIDKENRRIIARWILFLQSELEYEWPYPTWRHDLRRLITVITFGLLPQFQEPAYKDLGAFEVWPFFRKEDYERALHSPKLLAGA